MLLSDPFTAFVASSSCLLRLASSFATLINAASAPLAAGGATSGDPVYAPAYRVAVSDRVKSSGPPVGDVPVLLAPGGRFFKKSAGPKAVGTDCALTLAASHAGPPLPSP